MEQYRNIVIAVSGSEPLIVEYQAELWEWLRDNYDFNKGQVFDIGSALVNSNCIQYIYRK